MGNLSWRRLAWRLVAGVGLGGSLLLARPGVSEADAQRTVCPVCAQANSDTASYPDKAGHTLLRGVTNVLFGWTELIREPAQEARAGGNVFVGILQGAGQSVRRTAAGAGELLTFWTPKTPHGYLHMATDCPLCMGKQ